MADLGTLNGGAFNDIKSVDITIKSPMGYLKAENLGPNDVVLLCTPGNDGNIMNVFEGSTGQVVANKSYKVKNWSVTIRFLRHSLDYCKSTYLIQEMLEGKVAVCGIDIKNWNFGTEGDNATCESLTSDMAFLVNFQGVEAGAGASGDFEITFKLSNAYFQSGVYKVWSNDFKDDPIPNEKTLMRPGQVGEKYTDAQRKK